MNQPLAYFIRKVAVEVPFLTEIPLFGNSPPFSWELFSEELQNRLEMAHLAASSKEQKWLTASELKASLGKDPLIVFVHFSPLPSPVYFAISKANLKKLTSLLLNGQSKGPKLSSEILQEGYYRYLLMEALDTLLMLDPLNHFTAELGEEASIPPEGAFAIQTEIKLHPDSETVWGTILLTEKFRADWVKHFSKLPSEYIPNKTAQNVELTIGIKTGSSRLKQEEWKALKKGDFLLLDRNSYDPKKEHGVALLMLGKTPLFQTKIKHNKLEILNYAFIHEEPMEEEKDFPPEFKEAEEEVSPIKDLPMDVAVEIARMKITLDQLMHLNPGNILELPIRPDQEVSLTVGGKKVGRGELLHLGESLGVRLLEIG